jgi:hypothetical protein
MFDGRDVALISLIMLIFGMGIMMIILVATDATYRDGQIDAVTGKMYYKLVTNPDSTREWVVVKQPYDYFLEQNRQATISAAITSTKDISHQPVGRMMRLNDWLIANRKFLDSLSQANNLTFDKESR